LTVADWTPGTTSRACWTWNWRKAQVMPLICSFCPPRRPPFQPKRGRRLRRAPAGSDRVRS